MVAGDGEFAAVVFDLGGVLIEWDPRHLYRHLLPDAQAIEDYLITVGFMAWNSRQDAGRPWAEAVADLSAEHPQYAELIAAYPDRFEESLVGPLDEAVGVLNDLYRTGVRLLALTNWSAETFVHARKRFGFLELFEAIVVSGEERLSKPDPAVFGVLIDRYGLLPSRTVYIDDAEANVEVARGLGMHAIRFTSGPRLREQLRAVGLLVGRP